MKRRPWKRAAEVAHTIAVVFVRPPKQPAAAATPPLTRDAIRRKRKDKRAAKAAEPKPEAKPRGKLRALIGGTDTGKPAKSQREKEAARDAEFRRRHGRPPRVLVRTVDGPRVLYTDTTATPPEEGVTHWNGPSGYEVWRR